MSKLVPIVFMLIVAGILVGQIPDSPVVCCADYSELSFEVEAGKAVYLPYEPIQFRFRLVNRTSRAIEAKQPDFILSSRLKITEPQGNTYEISSLSVSSGGGPSLPGPTPSLKPQEKYEEEGIPAIGPKVFNLPGVYQVKFSLNGLESNTIQILIEQPHGKDKEAVEFLEKNGRDPRFGSLITAKTDVRVVKNFVTRFADSPFAEFAIQTLARHYVNQGKYDEAFMTLQRIKGSSVTVLAKQAAKELAEIEEKRTNRLPSDQQ